MGIVALFLVVALLIPLLAILHESPKGRENAFLQRMLEDGGERRALPPPDTP